MGIKGLWKELQPNVQTSHVSQFRGQRVAIDSYCWLHRGVIGSAVALATGKPCDKFIAAYMARIDMLIRYGVTPVCIFDGTSMPMKAETDRLRHDKRDAHKQEGMRLLNEGFTEVAIRALEKSIDVTTEVALAVIQVLKGRGIECVVAPYEADAQLAFMCREGYTQAAITEDSDLIVYGCCTIIAKMDGAGNCDVLQMEQVRRAPSFVNLTPSAFVLTCILSGCDYVSSLPNIGIKTALKLVSNCSSIPELMHSLSTQYGFTKRELDIYETNVHKALYCFAHHNIFDPATKTIVPFTPLSNSITPQVDLVGKVWEPELAESVCELHETDPCTLKSYKRQHRECSELYLRITEKGQRKLSEYSAFERHKAHKVVLAAATSDGAGRRFGHRDAAFSDNPVSGYLGGDSAAEQGQTHRKKIVVKSKYFSITRRDELFDSSSESLPPPQPTVAAESCVNEQSSSDDLLPASGSLPVPSSSSESSSPLSPLHPSLGSLCASAVPQPPTMTLLRGAPPRVGLSQPISDRHNSQQLSPPQVVIQSPASPVIPSQELLPSSEPKIDPPQQQPVSREKGVLFGGGPTPSPTQGSATTTTEQPTATVPSKPITAATFLQLVPDSPVPSPVRLLGPPSLSSSTGNKRLRDDDDDDEDDSNKALTAAVATPPPHVNTGSDVAATESHKVVAKPTVHDMMFSGSTLVANKGSVPPPSSTSAPKPKSLFTVHDLDDDSPAKVRSPYVSTPAVVDCDDSNGSVDNNDPSTSSALSNSTRRAMDMMAALRSRRGSGVVPSSSAAPSSTSSQPAPVSSSSTANVFKALAFQRGLSRNTNAKSTM